MGKLTVIDKSKNNEVTQFGVSANVRPPDVVLYVKLVAVAIFWGGTFVAGRIVAMEAGPFSASFLRFVFASFFLTAFMIISNSAAVLPRPRDFLPLSMLGLSGVFAYNVLFFSGLKMVTASRASLIIAASPAFIALLSAALFKEKLGFPKVLGIVLSMFGAAVVISKGDPATIFEGRVGLGELYIFGCVACWSCYSLVGKIAMRSLSPLLAVTYSCVIGAACLAYPALREGLAHDVARYSALVWLAIFYLGFFGSALGFFWYYEGIRSIGPSRAGVFVNLVPISAVLLAFLLLHEALDASLLVGAMFVISGVCLTNRS